MSNSSSKRRGRKIIIALGAVILLIAIGIALLPMLISAGFLNGTIANSISGAINGTATFDKVNVSWFGGQSVEGLKITGTDGGQVMNLNLTADASLPALISWPPSSLDATITGDMTIVRDEDGTNLMRLIKPSEEPISLPVEAANVRYDIDVTLEDQVEGRTYTSDDLAGALVINAAAESKVTAKGSLAEGGDAGTFDMLSTFSDLFDDDRILALAGGSVDFNLTGNNLPIPYDPERRRVKLLVASAASANLSELLATEAEGQIAFADGSEVSALGFQLDFRDLIGPDDSININPAAISGVVVGQGVPTALAQPFLAMVGVDAVEDIGPTSNMRGEFQLEGANTVVFGISATHTNLRVEGTVDPATGTFHGTKIAIDQRVRPQLVMNLAGIVLERPTDLRLQSSRFTIPPMGEAGMPWGDIAGAFTLRINEPVGVALSEGAPKFRLDTAEITADVPGLDETITIDGNVGLDGGAIRVVGSIDDLINGDGAFEPLGATPDLTVTIVDIPGETARALLASESAVVNAALDGQIRGEARITRPDGAAIRIVANVQTASVDGDLTATMTPEEIQVTSTAAAITVTEAISNATLGAEPGSLRVTSNPVVNVTIEPFTMRKGEDGWALPPDPLVLAATGTGLDVINAPAMTESVTIHDADLAITALLAGASEAGPRYTVKGPARLARTSPAAKIADAELDLVVSRPVDSLVTTGIVDLQQIDAAALAQATGRSPDALSRWTGPTGSATVSIESASGGARDAQVTLDFPTLKATLPATLTDQSTTVRSGSATVTLSKDQINALLAPESGTATLTATAGTTARVDIKNVAIPQGEGGAFAFDVTAATDRLALVDANGSAIDLSKVTADFDSTGLSDGITFAINTEAGTAPTDETQSNVGVIDISGTVTDLTDETGAFSAANATIRADGTVSQFPTALADAFLNQGGYLVAMLGSPIDATLKANKFSTTTGSLTTSATTPNGQYQEFTLYGRESGLRIKPERPFVGSLQLSDQFRAMLFSKLHPLFADVRQTENPLGITITQARLPVEGGVAGLDADLEITVGPVQFDSGNIILQVLRLAGNDQHQSVPGYVEPIRAKISNGVITYEQFATRVRDIELRWAGSTNLVTKQLNMRTTVPVESLRRTFQELKQLPDGTVIPLRIGGTISRPAPELDFQGLITDNLGNIIEDQLGDLLEKELGRGKDGDGESRPGIGGLLDGLLGGDDDEKADDDQPQEGDTKPD